MSFSSDTKIELSKIKNLSDKEQIRCELIGYLMTDNISYENGNIKFSTQNDYNINRFAKILENLKIPYDIKVNGKWFTIHIKKKNINFLVNIDANKLIINKQYIKEEQNAKAIIRGMFLGGGSINNPNNEYHLEINFIDELNYKDALEIIKEFNINIKTLEEKHSIYIKEGEEISKFLALIGANKAVMEFEQIRINKYMNGKINRIVNCSSANLNKTINASIEQIEAINQLKKQKKFNKLNDNLKEIANLRIENPDMPLGELGKLLKKPVGKSGVNYRLKKIIEIAKEHEVNEDE